MKAILYELYYTEFFDWGGKIEVDNTTIQTSKEYEEYTKVNNNPHFDKCYIGNYYYEHDKGCFYYKGLELPAKDPYGILNVNFSLINTEDKRWEEFQKQRLEQGFDESETWSLYETIAKFIYPRLKLFYNDGNFVSVPASLDEETWGKMLKAMVTAFDLIVNVDDFELTKEQRAQIKEGLQYFVDRFFDLWN